MRERERERDREKERERETDRQTDRHRQRERERGRERGVKSSTSLLHSKKNVGATFFFKGGKRNQIYMHKKFTVYENAITCNCPEYYLNRNIYYYLRRCTVKMYNIADI